MALIKVQDSVPECYENQSRDFQLIGRLYDCIINGVKFDIDTMLNLIDTYKCSQRMLPLLQTKLGFFSNKDIPDGELRDALISFSELVRNKGSLKSIKEAVNMFLKTKHATSSALIIITGKDDIDPYVVKIGTNASISDTTLLDEIFTYILPAGYRVEYFRYTDIYFNSKFELSTKTNAVYISNTINSRVRAGTDDEIGSDEIQFNNVTDHLVGAVDTIEVIGTSNTSDNKFIVVDSNGDESTIVPNQNT